MDPPPQPPTTEPAQQPAQPRPLVADPNAQTDSAVDPTERMRKLKMLHDEGLITDEEFQTKRAEILREM